MHSLRKINYEIRQNDHQNQRAEQAGTRFDSRSTGRSTRRSTIIIAKRGIRGLSHQCEKAVRIRRGVCCLFVCG